MIHFIQPFSFDLNIGKAYNEAIAPLEGWICITDQDTLKFEGFAGRVKSVVESASENDVITCRTNRLHLSNRNLVANMYHEPDINKHKETFDKLWNIYGNTLELTEMPIAGVFMLFHKSVWEKAPFNENSIRFDSEFTEAVRNLGFQTKVAKGLYIFHLYRWGRDVNDIRHLQKQ